MPDFLVTLHTQDGGSLKFSQPAPSIDHAYATVLSGIDAKARDGGYFAFTGTGWVYAVRARDIVGVMVEDEATSR